MSSDLPDLALLVPPINVFNLPLFEDYLVIDLRGEADFVASHIAAARSYVPILSLVCENSASAEDQRWRELTRFMQAVLDQGSPERYTPIVVYAGSTADNSAAIECARWLGNALGNLKLSVVPLLRSTTKSLASISLFEHFCQQLCIQTKAIWVIDGGLSAFCSEYPLLVAPGPTMVDLCPTPHHVCLELFIGSRAMEVTSKLLQGLHITHVICSDTFPANEFDVIFLRCPVRDADDQNMTPLWESAINFITDAAQKGGRVLAMLHGRSRSASIAVAWLMHKENVTYEDAMARVLACCPSIDTSLVYADQLRRINSNKQPKALPAPPYDSVD